jgi:hypothetical protein
MDHRPGLFNQAPEVLICPERIAAPQRLHRLAPAGLAHPPDGAIVPGHRDDPGHRRRGR